ncbi:hypothetical protein Sru01_68820 [Sphaerisporangium rufum]|uniref:DUF4360 domain-containing protein n=1 Tax=Sphaerisporangium rufum TaxID=1381558 RepID=A0A919V909_9ACTN|nr:DUF4360 domain-containing protein [Sphaerisporangium rufum]GII81900.1 hypothetical protein Sru01_68820 [Sphaerisporangium rufum]
MRRIITMGGAAAVLLGVMSAPANAADSTVPTEKITIDVVTVNGSGCPRGSATVVERPDNTGFSVYYSDYLVQVGPDAEPTDIRKNCQLNLLVHVPQGFTYAIAKAEYRGFGYLQAGASGLQQANYYFQGDPRGTVEEHPLSGPFTGRWQNTDTTDVAALVYKPCGVDRNLNINTELRVSAGSSNPQKSTSFMTMDSTRGSVNTTYHFAWQRCP